MTDNILTHEEVIHTGRHFDELSYNANMTQVLTDFEVCGGQPFAGLTYELTRTRKLAWYAWYNDGVRDGIMVEFDAQEQVKRICHYQKGVLIE